jgi:hypothetical protein
MEMTSVLFAVTDKACNRGKSTLYNLLSPNYLIPCRNVAATCMPREIVLAMDGHQYKLARGVHDKVVTSCLCSQQRTEAH